jgi:hypothetical protein
MVSAAAAMLPTPQSESQFTPQWSKAVMRRYFEDDLETALDDVEIIEVAAALNEVQGILSVTYVVDVKYKLLQKDGEGNGY